MSDGERMLHASSEASGAHHDAKCSNSDSMTSTSPGGNGSNNPITSSAGVSASVPSQPGSSAVSSTSSTVVGASASQSTKHGESEPTCNSSNGSKREEPHNNTNSDVSLDTFHTPSTSLHSLSVSGSSTRINGSNARRLSDFHSDLIQYRQEDQKLFEEEEEIANELAAVSASLPVDSNTNEEPPDSPSDNEDVGDEAGADDQQEEESNKKSRMQKHKRQSSAGSQCSLSSNPENSQFKTADAHSSDSDVSRNSGTTGGFVFDSCSISNSVLAKEDLDRTSLRSDHSHSGEHLNTSVESVELGGTDESTLVRRGEQSPSSSKHVSSQGPTSSIKPRIKKKMWYQQIFSTSYKTRSGDFKKIFKDLPSKERLIVDYSCALQKEILLQGRMYVSQNYVSFYANIFGWETQISVSFKEIESITKEKTALIIPNAIQISTMTEKFFFSSFVTRDQTYVMLFKLWQSALLEDVSLAGHMSKKELWRLVHTCYGEELGVTSEDESEDVLCPPFVATSSVQTLISDVDGMKTIELDPDRRRSSSPEKTAPEITVENCDDDQNDDDDNDSEEPRIGSLEWCRLRTVSPMGGLVCAGEIGPAIAVGLNIGSSIVTSNGIPIPISSEQLLKDANIVPLSVPVLPMTIDPSDSSDTEAVLESELRKELSPISVVVPVPSPLSEAIDSGSEAVSTVPPICPVDHSKGKETMNTVIPCNIDQLFTMLFTNSKFYLDFQLSRKTCDINQSDWQLGDRSQKTRQLTFTVQTGQIVGPKQAQVTETQTLVPESRPGLLYAIQSESVNAGIPYADAFAVNCHYCLSKISTTESKLIVISKIIYKKSTWAKTFIEKNSMAALNDFFSHLERALKEECAKMVMIGGITPTSPIISNLPRRRHPRKKCRAPDIPVSALTRPLVETSIIHPGVRQAAASATTAEVMSDTTSESVESSKTMKVILTVLGFLLLLNAFLYYKLSNLEASANTSLMFPPRVQFTGAIPQTHQEWLVLLQQQETLHRSEVHNWHEILGSAIGILHQAEKDLESLKKHISTYGHTNHVVKVAPPIQRESLDMSSANVKKSPQTPVSEDITVKQAQQENNNNDKNVVSNSERE